MKGKCFKETEELLATLTEISKLTYAKSKERSPKSILRLHNVTFRHALLCIEQLKGTKRISKEKLFGIYFHSILVHLPQVCRIIAPSSVHAEDEERLFSQLNSISLRTSSRTPESIRDNGIVRIQAEMEYAMENGRLDNREFSKISKFSKATGINLHEAC